MPRPFTLLFAGMLAVATGVAAAQAPVQLFDPNSIVIAGLQVAKQIDEGRQADVWEAASPVMKKLSPKAQFIDLVAKSRQSLGVAATTERVWLDVSRRESAGTPELPTGLYVNVAYRITFKGGKSARELVSFRLDEDKVWRVVGYVAN